MTTSGLNDRIFRIGKDGILTSFVPQILMAFFTPILKPGGLVPTDFTEFALCRGSGKFDLNRIKTRSTMSTSAVNVAVVGGGVTGATAVSQLVRLLPSGSTIVLFDQGRALGGRTSVRRIRADDGARIAAEDTATSSFAWDHGCQFFRADTAEFRTCILPEWLKGKHAVEWKGRFEHVDGDAPTKPGQLPQDFFGLPSKTPVYHGVGGMHAIASGVLREAVAHRTDIDVQVKVGARVASIERITSGIDAGAWQLLGTTGEVCIACVYVRVSVCVCAYVYVSIRIHRYVLCQTLSLFRTHINLSIHPSIHSRIDLFTYIYVDRQHSMTARRKWQRRRTTCHAAISPSTHCSSRMPRHPSKAGTALQQACRRAPAKFWRVFGRA